jgi:AraC-like DNA-binding protein
MPLSQATMGGGMSDRIFFSTDTLPERDRFPAFCEEIIRRYTRLDFVMRDKSQFRGMIELQRAGAVDIGYISTTPVDSVRSPNLVRDGDDSLLVMLLGSGGAHQTQCEHDQRLEPGDIIVCDCGYPGEVNVIADTRLWSLKIPRARITSLLPRAGQFAGAKLNKDSVARRLLFGYLGGSLGIDLSGGERATRLRGEHIIDLVALALGAEGEAREFVEQRGVGAVRRVAILRDIENSIADPNLNTAMIASRHGIAPRYVRLLLEETGRSFSRHVLEKRLERAAALLRAPQHYGRKVATVAFECGFSDLSYFNRVFRRRYGETPTDMRESGRRKSRD